MTESQSENTTITAKAADGAAFSPKIIAVGGGKGGVGKSMVSSGLGVTLSKMGHKTLIVDLDFGGSNMHTWLGEKASPINLSAFLNREVSNLNDLVLPSSRENLTMIQGAQEHLAAANLKHTQKERIIRHLRSLPCDWVILDLGAGSGFNSLDFFLEADRPIVVFIPEPTSIENAYRFLRAAFFRRLVKVSSHDGYQKFLKARLSGSEGVAAQSPRKIREAVAKEFPSLREAVIHSIGSFSPLIVINQVISDEDRLLEAKIRVAAERYLGINVRTLGIVRHDEAVLRAIRKRQNPVDSFPDSFAADDLQALAQRVMRSPDEWTYSQASLF